MHTGGSGTYCIYINVHVYVCFSLSLSMRKNLIYAHRYHTHFSFLSTLAKFHRRGFSLSLPPPWRANFFTSFSLELSHLLFSGASGVSVTCVLIICKQSLPSHDSRLSRRNFVLFCHFSLRTVLILRCCCCS